MAAKAAVAIRTEPIAKVVLNVVRETKNTFRFEAEDETAPVALLYVNKSVFEDGKAPDQITVEIH